MFIVYRKQQRPVGAICYKLLGVFYSDRPGSVLVEPWRKSLEPLQRNSKLAQHGSDLHAVLQAGVTQRDKPPTLSEVMSELEDDDMTVSFDVIIFHHVSLCYVHLVHG